MKNLKMVLVMLFALSTGNVLYAQNKSHSVKFTGSGDKVVKMLLSRSDVMIKGSDGNEVVIETESSFTIPERAKGLTPLFNGAFDNTGIGLEVNQSGNEISIKKARSKNAKYIIKIPRNTHLIIKEDGWSSGKDLNIDGINGEIEVKATNANIKVKNVTGPLVLNTTNGEIEVVYSKVANSPSMISAVNGTVDITMPAATKANLKINNYNGEFFTDFKIKTVKKEEGKHPFLKTKVITTINGGGPEITIKSINDDVYLRKGNQP